MKVLLVSATYPTTFSFHRKFLGLGCVHAQAMADPHLKERVDITHEFFNVKKKDPARIAEEILAFAPDLVGFGCYVWNTPQVLKIVDLLKQRNPKVAVIVGGPETDYDYESVLRENPAVDFVCVGEGEESFREFLHAMLRGRGAEEVAGIAFRGEKGPALSARRAPECDLDKLASPYLTGVFDVDEVCGTAYFQTTRGCPFKCAYCAYGRSRPFSETSFDRVEAEIRFFKDRGARALFCVDSTFNLDGKRAVRMLDTFAAESFEGKLWMEAHPKLLSEEFVEALGRSCPTYVGLGLQTTNPVAMENINRPWDPKKIGDLLDRLALHETSYLGLELIMGLPGDDLESFKDALSWVYDKEPTNVFTFPLEVLPGTELHRQKDRFEIVSAGTGSFHEIASNYTFTAEQIRVGKIMNQWNRQLQPVFFRLVKVSGLPAGPLLEEWAWFAYRAGLMEILPDLQVHRVEGEALRGLADAFEQYCAEVLERAGVPDVSRRLREFLRYYYLRREATEEDAFFFDSLDVHSMCTDPAPNRIWTKDEVPAGVSLDGAREETFEFDMKKLWPLTSAQAMLELEPERRTYRFLTGERGAAKAVEV